MSSTPRFAGHAPRPNPVSLYTAIFYFGASSKHFGIAQAAREAGNAAGFSFDTAAELSELFRVEREGPEGTFSEQRL